jgi:two-component system sensor histidine kinase YesM
MFDSFLSKFNIRAVVFASFTIASVTVELILSGFLWSKFTSQINQNLEQEKQIILSQTNQTLDLYVRNMMKVADALYYNVIKNADISKADANIQGEMELLLNANKDYIFSIALFSKQGDLITSYPAGKIKSNVKITEEPWFRDSLSKTENVHFFSPSIQNIFLETEDSWIIPLAHSVEVTRGRRPEQGVLLINTRYEGVKQIFNNAKIGSDGYVYLADADGKIIFHPKMQLINSGLVLESVAETVKKPDGSYEENFNGERRVVTIKTSGYTGWKIIGVAKYAAFNLSNVENSLFFILLFTVFVYVISIINLYISSKITDPIQKLEKSVLALKTELDENKIYSGGSNEVQSLSISVKALVAQMKKLMEDVVKEQETKRKYELDVLQSQINPHFLYNTLDVIVWMVENEKRSEAVNVVTALARLFRVSLSEGKTIIPLADEFKHVENYLTIQKTRYKNKFTYSIEADPEALKYSTLKLIIQPIVENAIYHGVKSTEGDIKIRAYLDGDLFIEVSDNGYGMTKEDVENLLKGAVKSKRGSGIGLKNIAERIKIYFGEEYGLTVVSAPDEGTKVAIKLPAKIYKDS